MEKQNGPINWEEESRLYYLEEGFSSFNDLTIEHIDDLNIFLSSFESFIEAEESNSSKNIKNSVNALSERLRGSFSIDEYQYLWKDFFENQLRSSMIISLMSVVEYNLNLFLTQILTICKKEIPENIEKERSIIKKVKKYSITVTDFKKPDENLWATILEMYFLRNYLVHNNGFLTESNKDQRIRNFSKSAPGLSIVSDTRLTLKKEFCSFAISKVRQLFTELFDEQEKLRALLLIENKGS